MSVAIFNNDVPTKLPRVTIYIEPDLKERLEKIATKERRSVSQMAIYLIEKALNDIELEKKDK